MQQRDSDPHWQARKEQVSGLIDAALKDRMVMEGKRLLLIFKKDGKEHLVSSLSEVGRAWQLITFEGERAGQINQIVNG